MHDIGTAFLGSLPVTVGVLIVWLQNKHQFAALNQRFDDMRELWRAELHRVEEVLDARLKHLEEN
jgi:hypothetical protein